METLINAVKDWAAGLRPYVEAIVPIVLGILACVIALALLFAFFHGAWTALSLPLRREQTARCFLRLLEIGLEQGRTIEQTVAGMTRAGIREMGIYLHLVAAWMERGHSLGAALTEVPQFLPKHTAAMLRVGEATGNVRGILQVCRETLRPGTAESNKQANNVMVLLLISPAGPMLTLLLSVFVLPRFKELANDMGIPFSESLTTCVDASLAIGIVASVCWLIVVFADLGHSVIHSRVGRLLPKLNNLVDRVQFAMPWRRKRLLRDFSALLATLMDEGVVEEDSVRLAAGGTANEHVRRRASLAIEQLRRGVALPDAMAAMDDSGEFQWRLRNAGRAAGSAVAATAALGREGFRSALAGWNDSLEARAYQQEQLLSQSLSTGFVLLNGLMVGLVTFGVFQFLTTAIDSITW